MPIQEAGTPANSFSLEGDIEMAFFPGRDDAYHVRINGDRLEVLVARMLGFPSEAEFDAALAAGLSPDPDVPSVVRKMSDVSLSVHQFNSDGVCC